MENLRAVSEYLNKADVEIKHGGYQFALDKAQSGDFVYLDPPYVPLTKTANFANYVKDGFGLQDQIELAQHFAELDKRGVKVMLSNSNTPLVQELYKDFHIKIVSARRSVNCKANRRGKEANEVLVTNYEKNGN